VQHVDGKVFEILEATVLDVSEPHPGLYRVLMVAHVDNIIPGASSMSAPEKVAYVTGRPPCVAQKIVLRRVRVARPLGSRHELEVFGTNGAVSTCSATACRRMTLRSKSPSEHSGQLLQVGWVPLSGILP
jgi:hypothetical protein